MNSRSSRPFWMMIVMVNTLLASTLPVNAGESGKVQERSEIGAEYLWATEGIFASMAEWESEFAAVEKRIPELAAFKGSLNKGPDQLVKLFKLRDDTESRLDRVKVYASLLADQDTRVGEHQAMRSRSRSLAVGYSEALSWLDPELTAIPFETLDSWMRTNSDLALYRHAMDDLFRQKKYILSPREEELLAMTGELRSVPSSAYGLLTNADIEFPTIKDEKGETRELDDSAFYLFMRSTDRRVRKDAYDAIVGTYAKYRNTAAALLNGAVQGHILTVKARSYDSCLAAALDGGNIPVKVYDTLVETINKNLHLLHRYQDIRKRALALDDGVHAYDLFAPLITGQTLEYSYEEAVDQILTALTPLGEDYVVAMKKGFESRWVDVYPTKGKRSGAYSSGTFLTQPYILMNFHGGYESMSTLAHEMGHSMHSFFSRGTQPYVYSDYSIFCAEVASTCNEIILQNYVLDRTKDPKKKLYLLTEFLESMRGTVFRQTMFSEFEQKIHEMAEAKQPLTADSLGAVYGEIMRKYYGPSYVHDDLVDNYWVRIPHFYYNFYVYKYATSYCAASNIARRIMDGEPGAREKYMKFLNGGSSLYPVDMLKVAGVDMTTPRPFEDAMKIFENLLDQTEALLQEVALVD
ncbi:MAG: oligoendopeptidase F [Planctomycetes bacterium]|nr:oligoendopeptidase F [Planctomycetota bacterium]